MIDRKELKRSAREAMKAVRPHPAWVTLAVLAILLVTQILSLAVSGDLAVYRSLWDSAMNGELTGLLETAAGGMTVSVRESGGSGVLSWLLTLALDLMTMVVSMGYSLYALRVHRRENPGVGDVFDAFGLFLRVVLVSLLRTIILSVLSGIYAFAAAFVGLMTDAVTGTLVCLPLLIPMYMAAYAYRLADFLVFDHPEYSAVQTLALSRMAMKGRKRQLFVLDLSFIGWILLSLVPFVILWVRPYMTVTAAGYYDQVIPAFWEEIKNRPIPVVPTGQVPGGWHVPGEKDEPDDADDDDDWF